MVGRGSYRHALRAAAAISIGAVLTNGSLSDVVDGMAAHAQSQADSQHHHSEPPGMQPRQQAIQTSAGQHGDAVAVASDIVGRGHELRNRNNGLLDRPLSVAGNMRPTGLPTDKLTCHRRDALWPTAAIAAAAGVDSFSPARQKADSNPAATAGGDDIPWRHTASLSATHYVVQGLPQPQAALLLPGSFNPPTFMHLRILEMARDAMRQRGWDVIGAYMSPVNNSYGKKGLVPSHHRIEMCRVAVLDSSFIMVDPWEAEQPMYQRTLTVLQRISDALNASNHSGSISGSRGDGTQSAAQHTTSATQDTTGAAPSLEGGKRGTSQLSTHSDHPLTEGEQGQGGEKRAVQVGGKRAVQGGENVTRPSVVESSLVGASIAGEQDISRGGDHRGVEGCPTTINTTVETPGCASSTHGGDGGRTSDGVRASDGVIGGYGAASTGRCIDGDGSASGGCGHGVRVVLVCGSDLLLSFATPGVWMPEQLEVILRDHGVVCIVREGVDVWPHVLSSPLMARYKDNILVVQQPVENNVSSSTVRSLLRQHLSVRYIIPDAVLAYICGHGLYGD